MEVRGDEIVIRQAPGVCVFCGAIATREYKGKGLCLACRPWEKFGRRRKRK